ncbi:hypothetical protein LY78DRAFT_651046 [Colletotrichum sublineola]|nr:hypothetical protein LY78DRAFT_651046 [Colletotrichum sublineola]
MRRSWQQPASVLRATFQPLELLQACGLGSISNLHRMQPDRLSPKTPFKVVCPLISACLVCLNHVATVTRPALF